MKTLRGGERRELEKDTPSTFYCFEDLSKLPSKDVPRIIKTISFTSMCVVSLGSARRISRELGLPRITGGMGELELGWQIRISQGQ